MEPSSQGTPIDVTEINAISRDKMVLLKFRYRRQSCHELQYLQNNIFGGNSDPQALQRLIFESGLSIK